MSGLNPSEMQRLLEWKYNNYMLLIKDNLNIIQVEKTMMKEHITQVLTERNLLWLYQTKPALRLEVLVDTKRSII